MKTLAPLQIRVEHFGRWYLLLALFGAAALLAAGWTVWVWRSSDSLPLMAAFSVAIFLAILSAQYPYWTIRPFTLFHGDRGWKLQRGDGLEELLHVRGMVVPGLLLVLGLSAKGRVVLPIPSDIQPAVFRELRLRLGALSH
ncbi:hypothetical protein GALL_407950 [mine drainage metagenome]|jgi:hypothetical protein|uniref:Uncharacterized protein n=1 Tax=mine drainage metagenome TaxID=410659 RepID=A0A1J5QNG0_9ZZZZ